MARLGKFDKVLRLAFGGRRMSQSDFPSPLPRQRSRSLHRRIGRIVIVFFACWGIYAATRPAPPSVLLPDGTKIIFHSVSRGKPAGQPSGGHYPMFKHEAATNDGMVRRSWASLRDHSPSPLARYMPDWPLHAYFRNADSEHELELRFFVEGSPWKAQWRIGIADDDGWETGMGETQWFPGYPSTKPGGPHDPRQLMLPGPLPRHARLLRIRFHPTEQTEPGLTDARQREFVAEMAIPNPIYEGPAPVSSTPALPVTKTTRFGELTLTRLGRERFAGPDLGGLDMDFELRSHGAPITGMSFHCDSITDRSGQKIWVNQQGSDRSTLGHYYVYLHTAPWSDDPVWKIKMEIHRDN